MNVMSSNKALHPTSLPLRIRAAVVLGRLASPEAHIGSTKGTSIMRICHSKGFLSLIFAMALLPSTGAFAANLTSREVEQVEAKLNEALMACDARALGTLWADELTFVFPNGALEDKAKRIAGLTDCTPGKQQSTIEGISVKVHGSTAVAVVLTSWKSEFDGKPFAAKFRATHVWAPGASGLVLVAAHVSQLK